MASKTIIIHRVISFAQASHTDQDVLDYFNQAFKAISPYWKGKIVGTGLTVQEQRVLMPYLHGVEPNERDFRKRTEDYFHEISSKIPPITGLKLEIGLEDDNEPISAENLPLNIKDYVTYRHAIGHPKMAMSLDEAERDPTKSFYVLDPNKIADVSLKLNEAEDKALACYFKYKDDEMKLDQILTMLGINIKEKTYAEKVLAFKKASRKDATKGEHEQQSLLVRFVEVCEDADLMLKYLIHEMIGAQVLEKQGTTIFFKEEGRAIGANIKEAVAHLKNPKNSKDYNILRAQYENIVRKGSSLPAISETPLPEDIDIEPAKGRGKVKPQVD